ncbi:MAG: aldo/keto reductase [Christensenellaceae bacterium]|nr:aldo/keto reductase [Christensenellaceae bacterium]
MQYFSVKTLDGSELRLSKLIYGADSLGDIAKRDGKEAAFEMVDSYREKGGNFIDTARFYGYGESEQIVGDYMQARRAEGQVHVLTKGGFPDLDDQFRMIRYRTTREAILGDFFTSYDRLRMKVIDIYILHRDDKTLPVSYIMDTLDMIAKTGLVRAIGVSNWSMDRIREANEYARSKGQAEIAISEIQWAYAYTDFARRADATLSIMNPITEPALYQQYLETPIPVIAFTAQARGLFSKLYSGEETWETLRGGRDMYNCAENKAKYAKILEYCEAHPGVTATMVANAYLTCNKLETGLIFSSRTKAQLEDTLTSADFTLTPEEVEWLDDIDIEKYL